MPRFYGSVLSRMHALYKHVWLNGSSQFHMPHSDIVHWRTFHDSIANKLIPVFDRSETSKINYKRRPVLYLNHGFAYNQISFHINYADIVLVISIWKYNFIPCFNLVEFRKVLPMSNQAHQPCNISLILLSSVNAVTETF